MKYFSIAGLQLDLERNNNKDLVIEKINQTVSRYPWLNMIVVSELAVGGASRSEEFFLDNNIEAFQNLAKERDIWLIPGSFYHRQDKQITNVAPVISNKGEIVKLCTKNYPFEPYEKGISNSNESCIFEIEVLVYSVCIFATTFGSQKLAELWQCKVLKSLSTPA